MFGEQLMHRHRRDGREHRYHQQYGRQQRPKYQLLIISKVEARQRPEILIDINGERSETSMR